MKYFTVLFAVVLLFHSCDQMDDDPTNDDLVCTEEFRTITVTITGGTLDDFYTIRQSTGDTIRYSNENLPFPNVYPILDDSFQSIIANSQETFDFIGIIDAEIVVDEEYVIEADSCHINLVSGNTEIGL